MSQIREVVRKFVLEGFVVDPESAAFTDEANLEECGILDSFSTLRLVSFIEERFQVQLERTDLQSGCLLSLASIEQLVLSKRELTQ